jgi:hypothetical protein
MRIPVVTILLSLILSTAGMTATPEEIVLSVRSSGAIVVPVTINGQGPFSFVLDTGASHSTVSGNLADCLTLPAVAKGLVSTTAGDQVRVVVKVERVVIGSASVEGLLPTVVALASLHDIEARVDGVIGQDFLSAFNYTLDYRRKRLRWTVPDGDEHVRLPLVRAGDRSLVELSDNGRDVPLLMVPDSGSEGFVVFERNGRTALTVEYMEQLVGVSAPGLRQVGRGAVLRELRVGAVTLRNQPAVVVKGSGSNAVQGDGLLPLHQFSSVAFNNTEGWIAVTK